MPSLNFVESFLMKDRLTNITRLDGNYKGKAKLALLTQGARLVVEQNALPSNILQSSGGL